MSSGVRERVFAWVGILVVIVSALALSAAAIIQQIVSDRTASQQPPALTCTDSNTEPTYAVPDAYIPSGPVTDLQSTDITVGTGATAKAGDCLVVKYYGTLASDGTKFDENYTTPNGFAFTLGQGQVIQGWDKGLVGMKVGGERRLVIPADQAYGDQASGSIPANSTLVFDVRLLHIQ